MEGRKGKLKSKSKGAMNAYYVSLTYGDYNALD